MLLSLTKKSATTLCSLISAPRGLMTPALVLVGSTPTALMFAEACLGRISHLVVTLVLSGALVISGADFFLFSLLHLPDS